MQIEGRFSILEKIGEGAYGAVYRAMDRDSRKTVALKVCKFQDEEEGIPSTCLREISILKSVSHPNLIQMIACEIFQEPNPRLEMAFEFIDYDLNRFIKNANRAHQSISEGKAKKIIKDILCGLRQLHLKGILHRDLKPHNILISKDYEVKIADFGLGRQCVFPMKVMSKEIETLWYRSPELLLGLQEYDTCVDMWSVGCILYEIIEGKALFQAESEIGQLFAIFQILGSPRLQNWPELVNMKHFKTTFPKFDPKGLPCNRLSYLGQQFVLKLLRMNPKTRIGVDEALEDTYFRIDHAGIEMQMDVEMTV